jgi:signal transduction histidine kinase
MLDVLLGATETRGILRGDDLPGAVVTVVDAGGHVRARGGKGTVAAPPEQRDRLLRHALNAGPDRAEATPPYAGPQMTAVAAPIRAGGVVIGAVLVEQPTQQILAGQPDAFERARVVITTACLAIAGVLLFFAWRLAWRIRRLRDEADAAIDPDGRVVRSELSAGRFAGDEIGDLSRTVSGLLGRLDHYTTFLEQIPRTLRHEISNPLNSLSTSLENLVSDHPELADSKYIQSAGRGVARIDEIVQGLTDAASLEQALRDDELERIDLAQLVARYVENFAAGCPERRFALRGADQPAVILASGFRIEQLLDKLFDNAVAFSPMGSEIEVEVRAADRTAHLCVSNVGPEIPSDLGDRVFDSMVTTHSAGSGDRPHLGIGLYVARLIVEHLGGTIAAVNRERGDGTRFEIGLPLANFSARRRRG